jgi:hypothetical protein
MMRPNTALAETAPGLTRLEKVSGSHPTALAAQEAPFFAYFPFLVTRFIFQTQCAGRLGPYLAPALRGALGEVLLAQQCSVDPLSCGICEETPYCALRCLFAAESPDQGPAPFVIDAPLHHRAYFDAGTIFSFHLTLFGRSIELFPAVFLAFEEVAARGLQKGRLPCRFLGAEQVYEGTLTPETSSVSSVTLEFQTPLRLKADEKMLGAGELDFAALWRRLRGRLKMLGEAHYGLRLEANHFPPVPKNIAAVSSNLRWAHLQNYSFRQRQRNSLSGLMGAITFAGELGPYLPYLRLGEITHVGSGCVYGLGRYRLILEE